MMKMCPFAHPLDVALLTQSFEQPSGRNVRWLIQTAKTSLPSSTLKLCAKTSPRPAGKSATVIFEGPPARATASSVGTPTTGRESVEENDLTVASPMRKPVKLPGPVATAKRSTSCKVRPASSSAPAMCSRRSLECERVASPVRDERSVAPLETATLPARVAVSMQRMSGCSLVTVGSCRPQALERALP